MNGHLIIDSYIKWIRDNSCTRDILNGKYIGITTPFLNRYNDHIEIYLTQENGEFVLTDDGETLADLNFVGVNIYTPKRKNIFEQIINGFGVMLKDDNLCIKATKDTLPQKKHALLQAILSVNDMYVLSHENIVSFFKEDLQNYLKNDLQIVFLPEIKLMGKSGYDHKIDFVIPKSNNHQQN
jgi:hypothetical protein